MNTIHVFGNIVTNLILAANNRGESEGCHSTLQKVTAGQDILTVVSGAALRFATRNRLNEMGVETNRTWDDRKGRVVWKDPEFDGCANLDAAQDDLGKKQDALNSNEKKLLEAEAANDSKKIESCKKAVTKAQQEVAKKQAEIAKVMAYSGKMYMDNELFGAMGIKKGETHRKRTSILAVHPALSLTPYVGDSAMCCASIGATRSAGDDGHPTPYSYERHYTRYQYGFGLTPQRLTKMEYAEQGIRAITSLGKVAGNHAGAYASYEPESIVLRVAAEACPRILDCFEAADAAGEKVKIPRLVSAVKAGDIDPTELFIGGSVIESLSDEDKGILKGATIQSGIKKTVEAAIERMRTLAAGSQQ